MLTAQNTINIFEKDTFGHCYALFKSKTPLGSRSGRSFFPVTHLQVSLSSPCRSMQSPDGPHFKTQERETSKCCLMCRQKTRIGGRGLLTISICAWSLLTLERLQPDQDLARTTPPFTVASACTFSQQRTIPVFTARSHYAKAQTSAAAQLARLQTTSSALMYARLILLPVRLTKALP